MNYFNVNVLKFNIISIYAVYVNLTHWSCCDVILIHALCIGGREPLGLREPLRQGRATAGQSKALHGPDLAHGPYVAHPCSKASLCRREFHENHVILF